VFDSLIWHNIYTRHGATYLFRLAKIQLYRRARAPRERRSRDAIGNDIRSASKSCRRSCLWQHRLRWERHHVTNPWSASYEWPLLLLTFRMRLLTKNPSYLRSSAFVSCVIRANFTSPTCSRTKAAPRERKSGLLNGSSRSNQTASHFEFENETTTISVDAI